MTWILWAVLGAFSLGLVNSYFKSNPWGLAPWENIYWMGIPTLLFIQYPFMVSYKMGPEFYKCWFIGSAASAMAGVLCSVFLFGEQPKVVNLCGMAGIIISSWLLIK